jgi:hypothetical protein
MDKRNDKRGKPKTRRVIKALELSQVYDDRKGLRKESCKGEIAECIEFNSSPTNFALRDSLYFISESANALHESREDFSDAKSISLQVSSLTTFSSHVNGNDNKFKRSKSIDFFIEGLLVLAPDQKETLDALLYTSSNDIELTGKF